MSKNAGKNEAKLWKIRSLAVKQYLNLPVKDKSKWEDHNLYQIYFSQV